MPHPTVSVIIPAYNAQKYLAQAIESVLAQSYPAVECIVVDDGSSDATAAIAAGYGSRISYLRQENGERSRARNRGAQHASGEWLSFLDADDLIAPEKIEREVEALGGAPGCDLVFSRTLFVDESGASRGPLKIAAPDPDPVRRLFAGNFITVNAFLLRRSSFEAVGGFDPALNRAEDWELLLRLALAGSRFLCLDQFLACYRIHGENTIADNLKMTEAAYRVARSVAERYRDHFAAVGVSPDAFLATHMARYGKELLVHGAAAEGRALIGEACRLPLPNRHFYRLLGALSVALGPASLKALLDLRSRTLLRKR